MLDGLSAVELIRLNIELENRIDSSGDLSPLVDSEKSQVAHFIISSHSEGCERFFRHDLPTSIREKLTNLDPEQALYDFELVKRILYDDKLCEDVWGGKGYLFKHIPDPSEFTDVLVHEGCWVVMDEHRPVA